MPKSLVSCIVPFYNSEHTITDCLESIASIEYSPLEIILVNDGSTDKSPEIAWRLGKSLRREGLNFIHLGDKVNRGISSAKNQGMRKMNGEFFFFAGSDDIQFPDRITTPLSYLKANPDVGVVYSDCELWHESEDNYCKRGFPSGMTNENSFLYQIKRSYLWSGVLFARRSAYMEFDEKLSSAVDYDWYFNQFFQGTRIHFIEPALARYRLHEKNTSKKLKKSKENVFKILQKYDFRKAYQGLVKTTNSDELNTAFAWYHFNLKEFDETLAKLSNIDSENFEKSFLVGVILAMRGDFIRSADHFQSICKKRPNLPEAFNNLSVCLISSSRETVKAKELLSKAIRINPNYLDAKKNLLILETENFHVEQLHLTKKPLRSELTHIDNYN